MLTEDGETSLLASTVGRELLFVTSHTIHHNAMIGAMVKVLGGDVPPWFGYAPSTICFLQQQTCAQSLS